MDPKIPTYDIKSFETVPAPGAGNQTPTISDELLNFLKALGGDDAKVQFGEVKGGVIDLGSFKDLKIFNPNGTLKINLDASNPEIRKANESLIELYMTSLVLEGANGPDLNQKLIIDLVKGLNMKEIPAVGEVGKSEGNAFMGGLVMVALADILAEFAKMESGIKKMSSVLFLAAKECMKDLAEAQAKNIEDKAKAQADAKIMQAVITAVTTGIQLGFALGSWSKLERKPDLDANGIQKTDDIKQMKQKVDGQGNKLTKPEKDPTTGADIPDGPPTQKLDVNNKPLYKSNEPDYNGTKAEDVEASGVDDLGRPVDHQGRVLEPSMEQKYKQVPDMEETIVKEPKWLDSTIDTEKARILTQLGTISSQLGQASSNLVEARSILAAGHADAENTLLNFMQEQMGKMQDVLSKMGNDADQKVGEIWDLLKGMFSAIAQAFKLK